MWAARLTHQEHSVDLWTMLRTVYDTFWDEDVWLPPNTTWEDIAPGSEKDVVYTDHRHLLYPIPLALVLIGLRCFLEK